MDHRPSVSEMYGKMLLFNAANDNEEVKQTRTLAIMMLNTNPVIRRA